MKRINHQRKVKFSLSPEQQLNNLAKKVKQRGLNITFKDLEEILREVFIEEEEFLDLLRKVRTNREELFEQFVDFCHSIRQLKTNKAQANEEDRKTFYYLLKRVPLLVRNLVITNWEKKTKKVDTIANQLGESFWSELERVSFELYKQYPGASQVNVNVEWFDAMNQYYIHTVVIGEMREDKKILVGLLEKIEEKGSEITPKEFQEIFQQELDNERFIHTIEYLGEVGEDCRRGLRTGPWKDYIFREENLQKFTEVCQSVYSTFNLFLAKWRSLPAKQKLLRARLLATQEWESVGIFNVVVVAFSKALMNNGQEKLATEIRQGVWQGIEEVMSYLRKNTSQTFLEFSSLEEFVFRSGKTFPFLLKKAEKLFSLLKISEENKEKELLSPSKLKKNSEQSQVSFFGEINQEEMSKQYKVSSLSVPSSSKANSVSSKKISQRIPKSSSVLVGASSLESRIGKLPVRLEEINQKISVFRENRQQIGEKDLENLKEQIQELKQLVEQRKKFSWSTFSKEKEKIQQTESQLKQLESRFHPKRGFFSTKQAKDNINQNSVRKTQDLPWSIIVIVFLGVGGLIAILAISKSRKNPTE